ncbi:hypothetical protein BU204_21090 [Actinophytocola xanthii]|uniref:Uncharacterized protein n=1 Tax=Actinophytocola xanthii TaxID=1912961 RepID=A0A1Q8CMN1_9PSEU|nr:hypothetical protein BU204_21090 [Actinophytocola xanthii]
MAGIEAESSGRGGTDSVTRGGEEDVAGAGVDAGTAVAVPISGESSSEVGMHPVVRTAAASRAVRVGRRGDAIGNGIVMIWGAGAGPAARGHGPRFLPRTRLTSAFPGMSPRIPLRELVER